MVPVDCGRSSEGRVEDNTSPLLSPETFIHSAVFIECLLCARYSAAYYIYN